MKTFLPKDPGVNRDWIVVDVAGKPLGRAAVVIANALRGKCKPTFTPAVDTGDFVVVVNAAAVRLSGTKESKKIYQRYSGFRGGRKTFTAAEMRANHPERMIEEAVSGMLPGNHLCRRMLTRLKIYAGADHPHQAQQPRQVAI
jgi:large subunit ribosomal protein L13